MTIIEQRVMNTACSALPRIAEALERIATVLEELGKEAKKDANDAQIMGPGEGDAAL